VTSNFRFAPIADIRSKRLPVWMAEWIGDPPRTLNEIEAFDAMRAFLKAFWERGLRSSEDIGLLLSWLDRENWANGMPNDPAMWSDWRAAVDQIKAKLD
jgi:hypothetical protein